MEKNQCDLSAAIVANDPIGLAFCGRFDVMVDAQRDRRDFARGRLHDRRRVAAVDNLSWKQPKQVDNFRTRKFFDQLGVTRSDAGEAGNRFEQIVQDVGAQFGSPAALAL